MENKLLSHKNKSGQIIKRIAFVPAKISDAHKDDPEKFGLTILNDSLKATDSDPDAMTKPQGKSAMAKKKAQAKELFKESDITMDWAAAPKLGSGLYNLGNTCFMNSVLQCLLHTPPLAKLLASGQNLVANPGIEGFDPIRMTRELLRDSLTSRRGYVEPRHHAKTMRKISRSFRLGRQEDAHEYLIALLDAMHDRSIAGINPKPPQDIEMTSFIYRLFGGKIRSQVKCTQCHYESNTYDPFLDLSLEITHANSVEKALRMFTNGEVLDGSNKYRCPKENKPVRAVKRMTVEEAPNVLVIQLKRFEFSFSGRKISKAVEFQETLDLSPFMSKRPKVPAMYDLYGVLVHQGHSMHSGHYFCYIKAAIGGEWHRFDDTRVSPTSVRNVLGQHPYMLFYMKRQPSAGRPEKPLAMTNKKLPTAASQEEDEEEEEDLAVVKRAKQQKVKTQEAVQMMANGVAKASRKRQRQAEAEDDEEKAEMTFSRRKRKDSSRQVVVQEPESDSDTSSLEENVPPHSMKRSSRRSHVLPMLNRRQKRFVEQKLFGVQAYLARHGNSPSPSGRRMARLPARYADTVIDGGFTDDDSDDDEPVAAPKAASKPSSREEKNHKKQQQREKSARADRSNGVHHDDAVEAPDWPPVVGKKGRDVSRNTAGGNAQANGTTAAAGTGGKNARGKAAVKQLLRSTDGAAVDGWDGERGSGALKNASGRSGNNSGNKHRRELDEYDLEYDRGKVKKLRSAASQGTVEAKDFDAAYGKKGRSSENNGPWSGGFGNRNSSQRGGGRGGNGRGRGGGRHHNNSSNGRQHGRQQQRGGRGRRR